MELKIITNKVQYQSALAEIESLMEKVPNSNSPDANRLLVISKLVEAYEKEQFQFELPEPIEAIKFRMEEQGLKQTDLIPFIGSKSKVSEVLSGKRNLTVQMIRSLSKGLGIPAEVLLQEPSTNEMIEDEINWQLFPIKEMAKKGWIPNLAKATQEKVQQVLKEFLSPLEVALGSQAMWRKTIKSSSAKKESDNYSLMVWAARVLQRASVQKCKYDYVEGSVDKAFMKELATLSWLDTGPAVAKDFLEKHGIILIIEPHLEGTYLDGCAMLTKEGRPVIGLTLRHDRIDNFWFTIMHEIAHVFKHLKSDNLIFLDNTEDEESSDIMEKEADYLSQEAFIPRHLWTRSDAFRFRTVEAVMKLARELKIHPAIVAGRIRRETKDFRLLTQLVTKNKVSIYFGEG